MSKFMPYLNEGLMHYLDPTDGLKNLGARTMEQVDVYDCMGSNLGKFPVPKNALMAAYVTGSAGVPWNLAQLAAHPDAVLIDQAPTNTPVNETADVMDIEPGAGMISAAPNWARGALASFKAGMRPGQRWPTLYVEESEETPVVNALIAAGITSGINLFLTKPMPRADAMAMLDATSGPFPYVGIQYEFNPLYDVSTVSKAWLELRSAKVPTSTPGPGTQVGWRFCSKCQGLFWGPGEAVSVCPRGAQHDGSQSHTYQLGFKV